MESFGLRLKQERERRGMTLGHVAESTKIGSRFLQAIEEERLDQLPGGIFNKGFIRAYGRCLGLDEEELIASYVSRVGEAQTTPETSSDAPAFQPVQRRALLMASSAALGVILLLGLAWYGVRSRHRPPGNDSAPSTPPRATASNAKVTNSSRQNSATSTSLFTVSIRAHEECWSLIQADRKDPIETTLEAGDQKTIQASDKVTIKVGNAGGVVFSFNGLPLPKQGGEEEVKTLTFKSNGLQ